MRSGQLIVRALAVAVPLTFCALAAADAAKLVLLGGVFKGEPAALQRLRTP
jgi:hypothetical protein